MRKIGMLQGELLAIVVVIFSCASKSNESRDCEIYTKDANNYFECYLHTRQDSCLDKAAKSIKTALSCDSLKSFNYWLEIKVLCAKENYAAALNTIERFEKISDGPDVRFAKGEVHRRLGDLESAKVCYEQALQRYDSLLLTDSTNTSLILGRLQAIMYLKGKQEMIESLNVYRRKYKKSDEFRFLEDVPLLLDSIP